MIYDDEILKSIVNHEVLDDVFEIDSALTEYFPGLDKAIVFESFIAVLDPSYTGNISKNTARDFIEKFGFWFQLAEGFGGLNILEVPILANRWELIDFYVGDFPWGVVYTLLGEENAYAIAVRGAHYADAILPFWLGRTGILTCSLPGHVFRLRCRLVEARRWEIDEYELKIWFENPNHTTLNSFTGGFVKRTTDDCFYIKSQNHHLGSYSSDLRLNIILEDDIEIYIQLDKSNIEV